MINKRTKTTMKNKYLIASIMIIGAGASSYCNESLHVFSGKEKSKGAFYIKGSPIVYDANDFTAVGKTVEMLMEDIESLTGERPRIVDSTNVITGNSIIAGTIGHSSIIDSLINAGLILTDDIKGKAEHYKIKTIKDGKA